MVQAFSHQLLAAKAWVWSPPLFWMKWHWDRFFPEYFSSPSSVSFQQCFIFIPLSPVLYNFNSWQCHWTISKKISFNQRSWSLLPPYIYFYSTDLLIVLLLHHFIFANACSVYVNFVRYNLKDSHHCHVCNCQLSTSYK